MNAPGFPKSTREEEGFPPARGICEKWGPSALGGPPLTAGHSRRIVEVGISVSQMTEIFLILQSTKDFGWVTNGETEAQGGGVT
jgi:hypothetical protein